jgi:SnoaL-like domain
LTGSDAADNRCFASVVDEIEARMRIEDALYRHSRGIDRNDPAIRASAYHDDATIDAGGGPQPIADLLAVRRREHEHTRHTAHSVTNVLIEFISARAAFVESHVLACELEDADYDYSWRGIQAGAAGARITSWGRYLDVFECREGDWRIRQRAVVYGDMSFDALESAPALPERFLRQRHGPGDPIDHMRKQAREVARELEDQA